MSPAAPRNNVGRRTGTGARNVDGAGAQLFDIEAEHRRRVIVRPRRPTAGATLLLFTGVKVIRLPSLMIVHG